MKRNLIIFILAFLSVSFLFIYKLDYRYFFADEILYIDAGREHLRGIYGDVMEVPLLTKYLAAIMYKNFDHDVFMLRLPFAIFGIITSVVIFWILKTQFGFIWGIFGMVLYASSNIINTATGMIMNEAMLNMMWAFFLFFFYQAINTNKFRYFLVAGIFFGLGMSTKFTSILLIPFILIFFPYLIIKFKKDIYKTIFNFFTLFFGGASVFILTYLDPMLKYGKRFLIDVVYMEVLNTYYYKTDIGKRHLIAGDIYIKSPFWTYGYFLVTKELLSNIFTILIGFIYSLFNRNLFVIYYFLFFIFTFIFHQIYGVKSLRYMSAFLLPAIILATSGFYYLSKKYEFVTKYLLAIIFVIFLFKLADSINLKRTEYNALFEEYLKFETANFTNDKKIYIYGSTRSSRWYKHGKGVGKEMFEISGNLTGNCNRFKDFDYLILENDQLKLSLENRMKEHVDKNLKNYLMEEKYGFLIYKKVSSDEWFSVCN